MTEDEKRIGLWATMMARVFRRYRLDDLADLFEHDRQRLKLLCDQGSKIAAEAMREK